MKNPIRVLRRKTREALFFKDKRPVFDVDVDAVYNDSEFKDRKRVIYFEYGEVIEEVFKPVDILDIGCANGYLLEYFHKKGFKEFAGLEGAEAAFKYMPSEVKDRVFKVDLRKEANILNNRKFYLVNCTEVGEHIPYKYEDVFLSNIEKYVDKYLILSWADTWEGWHGMDKQQHVNPRSKGYVKKKLKKMGLRYDKRSTDKFIRSLRKKQNVFDHWIRNVMVFERPVLR